MRAVIGTAGNERSNPAVARLLLRRLLFHGGPVPDWHAEAACAGLPVEVFYPASGDHSMVRAAIRVCRGCPVRAACLADALAWEPASRRHGIVGGLTAHGRRRLATSLREQHGGGAAA
jgi:hypothetical protein